MPDYRYDERGHLQTLSMNIEFGVWWGHVHEDQALECARLERA